MTLHTFIFSTIVLCKIAQMSTLVHLLPNPPEIFHPYTIFGLNSTDSYSIISTSGTIFCNISSKTNYTLPCECVVNGFSSDRNFSIFNQNSNTSVFDYHINTTGINIKILEHSPRLFEPVEIEMSIKSCGKLKLDVDVEYKPVDVLPNMEDFWEYVATKKMEITGERVEKVLLGCKIFGNPGWYRFRIRDLDDDKAISDPIFINSTSPPSTPIITLRSDSIFPHCTNDFVISWHLPLCNTLTRLSFRIRVFSVLEDAPEELIYLDELPIEENAKTLSIPCSHFDILYEMFCFELISWQKTTRKFELWDRKCVNTEPTVRIDGKWLLWTPWTGCSKSCGKGWKKRFRKCVLNREIKGSYCNGTSVEKEMCNTENCPENSTQIYDNSLNNTCDCGCNLTLHSGTIFLGSLFCRENFSKWVIPANPSYTIQMTVRDDGFLENGEKIRVLKNQEILWQNNEKYTNSLEEPLDDDILVTYYRNLSEKSKFGSNGVYITYRIYSDHSNAIRIDSEYSALIAARIPECTSTTCQNAVIITLIVAISLVLFVVVFTPTVICVHLTQKWRRRKNQGGVNSSDALLSSTNQRLNTEMLCSGGTECTHLSNSHHAHKEQIPMTITKRSIGIQLSVQSTPRFSRSARDTPRGNPSIVSGELEYDYYDPPCPGSILRPYGEKFSDEFVSEINIDEIVRRETSGWVDAPPDKCDVHTQI